MRRIAFAVCAGLLGVSSARADDDMAVCVRRRAELLKQAAAFTGDARTRQLIDADLKRAYREQAEGDGDECIEALDHAAKLLAGKD